MNEIKIIKEKISQDELKKIAQEGFGEMAKVVVDLERKIMAIGGELHADGEALLLKKGSKQEELWGINLYPGQPKDKIIEFSALINIRPSMGHRSMEIEDLEIRKKIEKIIEKLIE